MKNDKSDSFDKFCAGQPESEAVRDAVQFAKATGNYNYRELDPIYEQWMNAVFKDNSNYEPFCREAFDRNQEAIIKANTESGNALDEKQLFRAFCEALACGDFRKQVVAGTHLQNFIYIPYSECDRLRNALHLAVEILEKDFDYRPDDDERWPVIRAAC